MEPKPIKTAVVGLSTFSDCLESASKNLDELCLVGMQVLPADRSLRSNKVRSVWLHLRSAFLNAQNVNPFL